MGVITFNGVSSDTLGIVVQTPPDYVAPEKDYEITHVPGRNGDIVIDKGSYQNVERTYNVALGSLDGDFATLVDILTEWLYPVSGYARLEDSYDPDHYRLAMYKEAIEITNVYGNAACAEITFDCKPQRFLTSGEETLVYEITNNTGSDNPIVTIENPTLYTALPLITIAYDADGSAPPIGGLTFAGRYMSTTVDSTEFYEAYNNGEFNTDDDGNTLLTIDSSLMDYWDGSEDRIIQLHLSSDGFPVLFAGTNQIIVSSVRIVRLEVTPRWWTI